MKKLFSHRKLLGGVILIILIVLGIMHFRRHAAAPGGDMPLPTVQLATVVQKNEADSFQAIGTVKAQEGTDITSPMPGTVASMPVTSGQVVKKGQVLFTLRNDDLSAVVQEDSAKYNFAKDQYQRYAILSKDGVISKSDVDQDKSLMNQAKAQMDHDQAILNNTIITAPFSGVLGVSEISVGQYITPGETLVSLQDRSTLHVDFYVPERVSDLVQVGRAITASSQQSTMYEWQGIVQAVGSSMDNDTRSLLVRAKITSPLNNLVPGMYVNVNVAMSDVKPVLMIPQQAVVYNPFGDSVYVYAKGKVAERDVQLGEHVDDWVVVKSGLKLGERIVIAGQQKLYPDAQVKVEK